MPTASEVLLGLIIFLILIMIFTHLYMDDHKDNRWDEDDK